MHFGCSSKLIIFQLLAIETHLTLWSALWLFRLPFPHQHTCSGRNLTPFKRAGIKKCEGCETGGYGYSCPETGAQKYKRREEDSCGKFISLLSGGINIEGSAYGMGWYGKVHISGLLKLKLDAPS